jgi:hypothetical protein
MYVRGGGYVWRYHFPSDYRAAGPLVSRFKPGEYVTVYHRGGTPLARVTHPTTRYVETWFSHGCYIKPAGQRGYVPSAELWRPREYDWRLPADRSSADEPRAPRDEEASYPPYVEIRVVREESYAVPMVSATRSALDGRTPQDLLDEWFGRFPLDTHHATRDGHRIGNSSRLIKAEVVPAAGRVIRVR